MPTVLHYLQGMCQFGTLRASYQFFTLPEMWPTNLFIVVMLVVEWLQRKRQHGLDFASNNSSWWHGAVYIVLFLCVEFYFLISIETPSSFIYFQF